MDPKRGWFAIKDLEGFYESCGFHAEGEVIDSTVLCSCDACHIAGALEHSCKL